MAGRSSWIHRPCLNQLRGAMLGKQTVMHKARIDCARRATLRESNAQGQNRLCPESNVTHQHTHPHTRTRFQCSCLHTRTVLSLPVLMIIWPSADIATPHVKPVWPVSVLSSLPLDASQTLTVSTLPDVTICLLSDDQHTWKTP
jgi:hypothetical protein